MADLLNIIYEDKSELPSLFLCWVDYQKRVESDGVEMVTGHDDKEDDAEFKPASDDDEGEEEKNDEANKDADEDEEGRGRKR